MCSHIVRYLLTLVLGIFCATTIAGGNDIKLKYTPSGDPNLLPGQAITLTLYDQNTVCSGPYTYSIDSPPVGSATLIGNQVVFSNDGTNGYLSSNKNLHKFKAYITCTTTGDNDNKWIKPKDDSAGTGGGGSESTGSSCNCSTTTGDVILDNTAHPNAPAIGANLVFLAGGSKGSTAIDDGIGGNAINILDFQTVTRDISTSPDSLNLIIGDDSSVVDDNNYGTENQLDYFSSGKHLFELNRLRSTADWLSQDSDSNNVPDNISPAAGVVYGTYGTLSMSQFIANIASGATMYGMVRVKVPLELDPTTTGTAKNALGDIVNANSIYSFCSSSSGLCSCSPGISFSKIESGVTICGHNIPSNSKIKVKGSLLWDFVDNITGNPVDLDALPWAPRDLYFKVEMPIMVDWSHDLNDDGAMDNMPYIKGLTSGKTGTNPIDITNTIGTIDFTKVSQSSKDAYLFATGTNLDATVFATLNKPDQYHLLMASGYADGWAEAFTKLNITAAIWKTLPPNSCVTEAGGSCDKFSVPDTASGIMTANDVRSGEFEDIPTYLYSGGLIDMHHHVNISGLIYVPQGMELEAKDSNAPTQQYVSGAIVVRDSFYIEAKDNTITVMSSDPDSYSTARVSNVSQATSPTFANLTTYNSSNNTNVTSGESGNSGNSGSGDGCFGCASSSSSGNSGGSNTPNPIQWVEIHPQN
ncbi:MAG: hypothetical protein ACE5EH_10760 [Gammaproteobacteria bacterium]